VTCSQCCACRRLLDEAGGSSAEAAAGGQQQHAARSPAAATGVFAGEQPSPPTQSTAQPPLPAQRQATGGAAAAEHCPSQPAQQRPGVRPQSGIVQSPGAATGVFVGEPPSPAMPSAAQLRRPAQLQGATGAAAAGKQGMSRPQSLQQRPAAQQQQPQQQPPQQQRRMAHDLRQLAKPPAAAQQAAARQQPGGAAGSGGGIKLSGQPTGRPALATANGNLPPAAVAQVVVQRPCPVCSAPAMLAPWVAPCQHTACNACWVKAIATAMQCPVCSARTHKRSLTRVLI